jgi:hypothetical protein
MRVSFASALTRSTVGRDSSTCTGWPPQPVCFSDKITTPEATTCLITSISMMLQSHTPGKKLIKLRNVTFCRMRICKAFADEFDKEDEMTCIVNLKDRAKTVVSQEENNWYNQAFGSERNMMNLNVMFQPDNPRQKQNGDDVFVVFKYQMFEEHKEEFKDRVGQFPENNRHQMEFIYDELDQEEETGQYMFDMLLPYGDLKTTEVTLEYVTKPKKEGAERDDP